MANQVVHQGKPETLAEGFRKYIKTELPGLALKAFCKPMTDSSKIMTVCHGDFWLNNILFNEDESRVFINGFSKKYFFP